MRRLTTLLVAAPVAFGLLAAPAAHAEWRGHGYGGGHYRPHYQYGGGHQGGGHHGGGSALLGTLLGLGTAAIVGGIIASQPRYYQPPAYYAPQQGYYPAPAYAPAPYGYYPAPGPQQPDVYYDQPVSQ